MDVCLCELCIQDLLEKNSTLPASSDFLTDELVRSNMGEGESKPQDSSMVFHVCFVVWICLYIAPD